MVNNLRDQSESSGLDSCIAIVDVSGSMGGMSVLDGRPQAMLVAVALGILLSQLAREPWNKLFITFSERPTIQKLDGSSLKKIAQNMQRGHWGMSTDFVAAFKLLLDVAVEKQLKQEDMVKKVFVFSDMQFNDASGGNYTESTHDHIEKLYRKHGYELPTICYWNIAEANYGNVPVKADTPGVEVMSGYSASLMKIFLGQQADVEAIAADEIADHVDDVVEKEEKEEKDEKDEKDKATPAEKLAKVLANATFAKLKVYD